MATVIQAIRMALHYGEEHQALQDPKPMAAAVEKSTFADSPVDVVYPGDYTGLPE